MLGSQTVGCLVVLRPSNMLVCLRDGSAQTVDAGRRDVSRIRLCTLKTHARQHISSMCSTFPYMEDNYSTLGQSDFCPFASQGFCLVSDWLSMVLWCDDSKPKRSGLN